MCTGITVTRRYVLLSWRTNIAGSNIIVLVVATMETSSAFLRNRGISKRAVFLRMDWQNMTLASGDYFVVSTFSSIFPSML